MCIESQSKKKKALMASSFACPYPGCTASFTRKGSITLHHRAVHLGIKDYKCKHEGCLAAFAKKSALDDHVAGVHLHIKRFMCEHPGCGAAFTQKSSLGLHLRLVHVGSRPYVCEHEGCAAAFKERSKLKTHVNTVHLRDRSYTCYHEGCSSAFSDKSDLRTHIKVVHLKERKYACQEPGCSAAFCRKSTLVQHDNKVHKQLRPHACEYPECSYASSCKSNLNIHVAAMHTSEGQQRHRKKEEKVRRALRQAALNFKSEHQISFECWGDTFARTDFLMLEKGVVLLGEVDENQHKTYGVVCELARMTKTHTALAIEGNTSPVGFIRYNPDAFKVAGVIKKVKPKDRLRRLLQVINEWQPGPEGSLQIQYMFYDCCSVNGALELDIWNDINYSREVRSCCKPPIID